MKSQTALWPLRPTLAVAAAAVATRLAMMALTRDSAFLHTPVVDASFYDIWADTLARGRVFQDQSFFKPPFYAYLLAFLYKLGLGMQAVIGLQLLTGVGTSLLTLALGRLAFDGRTALAGALICALLPILTFFEIQLLAESWTTALTMGGLVLILLVTGGRRAARGTWLGGAGILLGLAALGRPNLLLTVAVIVAWLFLNARRGAWTRGEALALMAGFLVAIAPATLHNLKSGDPSLISANLGANLVAGNSDTADGTSAIPVGIVWDDLQLRARQAGKPGPGASSRFLTEEALSWMAHHPGRTLQLLGRKLLLLVGGEEPRNNINPRWFAEKEGVFLLARWWPGTWLVIPFAVVGLIFGPLAGRAGPAILRWFVAAQVVAILPFFVTARFRAPILPVLALFAACGAFLLWEKRRDLRRLWPMGAVFLTLLIAGNVDWLGLRQDRWLARDYFNQGLIFARSYAGREPDPVRAEENFRRAIELDPSAVDFPERLGTLILAGVPDLLAEARRQEAQGDVQGTRNLLGRTDSLLTEATRLHREAARLHPRSFRSWSNLGTASMWRGDVRSFEATLAGRENDAAAARNAAVASLGDYQAALDAFQQSLLINPDLQDTNRKAGAVLEAVLRLPDLDPAIGAAKQAIAAGRRGG